MKYVATFQNYVTTYRLETNVARHGNHVATSETYVVTIIRRIQLNNVATFPKCVVTQFKEKAKNIVTKIPTLLQQS